MIKTTSENRCTKNSVLLFFKVAYLTPPFFLAKKVGGGGLNKQPIVYNYISACILKCIYIYIYIYIYIALLINIIVTYVYIVIYSIYYEGYLGVLMYINVY